MSTQARVVTSFESVLDAEWIDYDALREAVKVQQALDRSASSSANGKRSRTDDVSPAKRVKLDGDDDSQAHELPFVKLHVSIGCYEMAFPNDWDEARKVDDGLDELLSAGSVSIPILPSPRRRAAGLTHHLELKLPSQEQGVPDVTVATLRPFDMSDHLAVSFARTHKLSRYQTDHIPTFGAAGVFDAVTCLGNLDRTIANRVVLTATSSRNGIAISLSVESTMLPSFYTSAFSMQKRFIVSSVFPSDDTTELGEQSSIDLFYHGLQRAPVTRKALPIDYQSEITSEALNGEGEDAPRIPSAAKGKGKASNQDSIDDGDQDMRIDDDVEDELLRPPGLKATLMPFQSRSVRWLLAREGKMVAPPQHHFPISATRQGEADVDADVDDGDVPMPEADTSDASTEQDKPVPLVDLPTQMRLEMARGTAWERIAFTTPDFEDCQSRQVDIWLNRLLSHVQLLNPADEHSEGGCGLLSEEMGLGKTCEIISLILMHRQPERNKLPAYHSDDLNTDVQPTGLTLIIVPQALLSQWQAELEKHAPSLRVFKYAAISKMKESWEPLAEYISERYDIVLTTFDVLRREVAISRKPHERSTRSCKEERRMYRRSLLVQIDWLRVISDEVQMLGDIASSSSETASLIPRKYSFAVTGTPLKTRIEDLQGLLRFLKVEPFGSSRFFFGRLLDEKEVFVRMCAQLGARTLKSQVQHELFLPKQNRVTVPVELGTVERYWYEQRYAAALDALGLKGDGSLKDDLADDRGNVGAWEPDTRELNSWLTALRQLCSHPQIGAVNKRVLGGVIKSVEQVLETMRNSNKGTLQSDQRALYFARVRRAQYTMFDHEECERFEKALDILKKVLHDIKPLIQEVVEEVHEIWNKLKEERAKHKERKSSVSDSSTLDGVAGALAVGLDDETEEAAEKSIRTDTERALINRLSALRNRLRDVLVVQHAAQFFIGSCYFNMGKFELQETEAYAAAEQLRQTMLKPWEDRVDRAAIRLRSQMDHRDEEEVLDIEDLEFDFDQAGAGLVAGHVFDELEQTTDIVNGYAELIWKWREEIFKMLYSRVSIAGNNATGEEYAERAVIQERCDVYLEIYRILLADWKYALGGERNALVENLDLDLLGGNKAEWMAVDEPGQRRGKGKRKGFKARRMPTAEAGDAAADVLRFQLLAERAKVKGDDEEEYEITPIRFLLRNLRDAADAAVRNEEIAILNNEQKRVRDRLSDVEKVCDRLHKETNDMTKAYNERVSYFKHLQAISDEVADPPLKDPKWHGVLKEIETKRTDEAKLQAQIQKLSAQRRYLESIADDSAADTTCIICSDNYTRGVLTVCAHSFCKDCFNEWRRRSQECPICKRELKQSDWELVKFGQTSDQRKIEHVEPGTGEFDLLAATGVFEEPVPLRMMSEDVLNEIQAMPTVSPLSSKTDMIVKHIKYLRREDSGAKIVLFSAWTDSLAILMQAFTMNGIGFVRLEGSSAGKKDSVVEQFKTNPNIAVFVLHTRSQAAGLNLVCARYVMLVEPLLHPSLELQAVGRVHRIGQKDETTVFQYYVADSVDERVGQLRARNKTSLFTTESEMRIKDENELFTSDVQTTSNLKSPTRAKRGSKAIKSSKDAASDTIEDTDSIVRCLLEPDHFLALQKALLPARLRDANIPNTNGNGQNIAPGQMAAAAALQRQAQASQGG